MNPALPRHVLASWAPARASYAPARKVFFSRQHEKYLDSEKAPRLREIAYYISWLSYSALAGFPTLHFLGYEDVPKADATLSIC